MISLMYLVKLYFDENKDNTVASKLSEWIKKQPIDMQFKVQEGETMWSDPSISCACKTANSALTWQDKIRTVINELGGTVVCEEDDDE